MKIICFISNLLICIYCYGQNFTYIDAYRDQYKRLNDSVISFRLAADTNFTCTLNRNLNYLRIYDKQNNLIEEGFLTSCCVDCSCRGKNWKVYYKNGSIKENGDHYKWYKINDWKYFYENGSVLRVEKYFFSEADYQNQSLLISEYEYYENGQLKMDGQYVIDFYCKDSLYIMDPTTEIPIVEVEKKLCSKKCGTWSYYFPDGSLMKKEEY